MSDTGFLKRSTLSVEFSGTCSSCLNKPTSIKSLGLPKTVTAICPEILSDRSLRFESSA
jgi:Fe-S cluster biogenesis protein NfuA